MHPRDSFPVLDHLDGLRRYAMSLTRDLDAADDLVHDTLVKAYDKRRTFRADGDLRRWLLAILHNAFVNDLRRLRVADAKAISAAALRTDRLEAPQDYAVEISRVRETFDRLPVEQRAVLHLVVSEGLSYQEVSQLLNIPVGTVMSRLSRARAALRPAVVRPTEREERNRRKNSASSEAQMNSIDPITEADLQGYVDDQLAAHRRREVEQHLAAHPDIAAHVMADLANRGVLRDVMNEDLPPSSLLEVRADTLDYMLRQHEKRISKAKPASAAIFIAAAIAIMLLPSKSSSRHLTSSKTP